MDSNSQHITLLNPTSEPNPRKAVLLEDYSEILDRQNVQYDRKGLFLEVGKPDWLQGWLIELSVIPIQVQDLIETILPFLVQQRACFRIVATAGLARAILGGEYGYLLLGKLVTIFPKDEVQALDLARELVNLTGTFKGPEILTNRRLGSVVFTRYGAVNPIVKITQEGSEKPYIRNKKGDLVEDPFSIPFQLPHQISWPFGSLALPRAPKLSTVLQDKYKPMAILKEDAKGAVKKGLYLEKLWRIKWCVIKEGKANMIGDSKGRDMTDRLRWQYELHKDLGTSVPLPRIYDFFEENGNTYLVMEYVKGQPLDKIVVATFNDRLWISLSLPKRLQLLDYSLQILGMISQMHDRGYVHRDITPANFLSDSNRKLWMIDLELSYNYSKSQPYPPFRLGTPGYMSPEQENTRLPKPDQDVYAIGALFILLLTGLPVEKFAVLDEPTLKCQLEFFIPDQIVASTIARCLNENPGNRPTIAALQQVIGDFKNQQLAIPGKPWQKAPGILEEFDFDQLINNAIQGLGSPEFLTDDQLWYSMGGAAKQIVYSQDSSKVVYPGFSHGLSGILYFLAKAHRMGLDLGNCYQPYESSIEFIRQTCSYRMSDLPGGLYKGSAGIGLAISEGIQSGLIVYQDEPLKLIQACFLNENIQDTGVNSGFAGQGISILHAKDTLGSDLFSAILTPKISRILELQQKDGSWTTTAGQKIVKATGFGRGIAGILCFLLGCIETSSAYQHLIEPTQRGLDWLVSQSSKKRTHVRWYLHSRSSVTSPNFEDGCAGIVLCLTKAYKVFKMPIYRRLAEDCLRNYQPHPVSVDATQTTGLTGLAELYLEARECFQSEEWQARADWIARFLLNTYQLRKDGTCYWMPDGSPFSTAGFLEGNSGIIHFLLRFYKPGGLGHPILTN